MNITSFEAVRSRLESQPPKRILLIHPTKYLGNLLISGYLIQAFGAWCKSRGIEFALVLDKQYEAVFADQFVDVEKVYWYPREQVSSGNVLTRAVKYFSFVSRVRRFRPDLVFNLEEDSVASMLVRLSGAAFRLGCSQERHRYGFDAVLPVEINNRPEHERHRWYSYREVFTVFPGFIGALESPPSYLKISIDNSYISSISHILSEVGSRQFIVIHPGGTKAYKRWPDQNYADLAEKIAISGDLPVFIGAGEADSASVDSILRLLEKRDADNHYLNLCNRLDLTGLMALFTQAAAMVGNDSGPFHLGSALNLPGVVLFGPTETGIWGPLGQNSRILHKKQFCRADCTRHHCDLNYQCLSASTADEVIVLLNNIQKGMASS